MSKFTWGERVTQLLGIACVFIALLSIWPKWEAIFCLLKHEDAASWVQAIGSIAAIIGAFAIANYQFNLQRKAATDSARSALSNSVVGLDGFARKLRNGEFESRDVFIVTTHRRLLEDYLLITQGINSHEIGVGFSQLLFATRVTLIQLILVMEEAEGAVLNTDGSRALISLLAKANMKSKANEILKIYRESTQLPRSIIEEKFGGVS